MQCTHKEVEESARQWRRLFPVRKSIQKPIRVFLRLFPRCGPCLVRLEITGKPVSQSDTTKRSMKLRFKSEKELNNIRAGDPPLRFPRLIIPRRLCEAISSQPTAGEKSGSQTSKLGLLPGLYSDDLHEKTTDSDGGTCRKSVMVKPPTYTSRLSASSPSYANLSSLASPSSTGRSCRPPVERCVLN